MEPTTLGVLLRARLRAICNRIFRWRQESRLKIAVIMVAGAFFWGCFFLLFERWFYFVQVTASPFHDLILSHILSLFFLTLFLMLAFSNAVISMTGLFRSAETEFLFSLPLRPETTFLYKMGEALTFSSWAFFALGLPLLLAYGLRWNASWEYYVAMVILPLPFVVLASALGTTGALLAAWLMPRRRGWALAFAGLILALVAVLAVRHVVEARVMRQTILLETEMQELFGRLRFVQNFYTPNYWITRALTAFTAAEGGGLTECLYFSMALISSAVFVVTGSWVFAAHVYPYTFAVSTAVRSVRKRAKRGWLERVFVLGSGKRLGGTVIALKDFKTFLRDPAQWSQALIFFGLLAVYIGNLRNFPYPLDKPFYQNMISFLNLGAVSLTLATLAGRFAFPMISLEGQRFWILGLAPVRRREILYAKFFFFFICSLAITGALVLLSNWMLRCEAELLVLQMATAGMLCAGLSGLAVGMGALFPNLRERNPSKIISGFGGTLTLLLAVGLVVFPVFIQAMVCHDHYVWNDRFSDGLFVRLLGEPVSFQIRLGFLLGGTALFSIACAVIPLYFGGRALEQMEF